MKKLIIVISILLIAVLFVACNATSVRFTGKRVGCVRSENEKDFSLSCESFNGTATYTITLSEETGNIIEYAIEYQEGKLTIEFINPKNEVLYTREVERNIKDIQGIYNAKDFAALYGKCKIKITAENFKGSYKFNWDNVPDVIDY